jgi:hypothetical protein
MSKLQRACCCVKSKKKTGERVSGENLLHYVEAVKHFP